MTVMCHVDDAVQEENYLSIIVLMEILIEELGILIHLNMNFVSDVSPEIQKIENLFSNMNNLFPWFVKG